MINSKQRIDFKANLRFRRLALNTVITLYLLIIAGGVVRSTGAGMGCPDWPRCFGSWVPPTDISQLPANYKEIYGAKLKGEIVFNPVKTWIEYVNRLLGAFTGIMIFCTLLASIHFVKSGNKQIFFLSLGAFILVGFQGWLGAKVVSFELLPIVVTLHMLLAIVIVFILLYLYAWSWFSTESRIQKTGGQRILSRLSVVVLIFSLAQILLGTQVRESIDEVIVQLGYEMRSEWVDNLGLNFYIHRSFSILVLAVNGFWIWKVLQLNGQYAATSKIAIGAFSVLIAELVTGVILAYLGMPAAGQPIHLTLAILLIGLQFVVWLLVNGEKYLSYNRLEGEIV